MALSELARHLRLPKSSVHCLLLTLEHGGYLRRRKDKRRYVLDVKLFSLANMAMPGIELRERAAPFLLALMKETNLTVHMAILEQCDVILIYKIEPSSIPRVTATWLGKRMDAHCTGVGKALLAYMPNDELGRLIKEHGLPRHNENTIASIRKLKETLVQIKEVGYSVDDEEDEVGFRCIGSPLFDDTGQAVAAISIAGTVLQITEENLHVFAEKVKKTANAISRQMGYSSAGRNTAP